MHLDENGNQIGLTRQEHLDAIDDLFREIPAAQAFDRGYDDRMNGRPIPVAAYFLNRTLVHISWVDYRAGWKQARADLERQPQLPLW